MKKGAKKAPFFILALVPSIDKTHTPKANRYNLNTLIAYSIADFNYGHNILRECKSPCLKSRMGYAIDLRKLISKFTLKPI